MRLLSIAALAATSHAGGPEPAKWWTITHKGVQMMGQRLIADFGTGDTVPAAPSTCKSYIPDQKFAQDDIIEIIALLANEPEKAGSAWEDWTHGLSTDFNTGISHVKFGLACDHWPQLLVIDTDKGGKNGYWNSGAFAEDSQPTANVEVVNCNSALVNIYKMPLVVYACESAAVNGNWGEWSEFGECKNRFDAEWSAECEQNGLKHQTRECNSPAPADGGQWCTDEDGDDSLLEKKSATCTGYCAPVDGNWGAWADWGQCEIFGIPHNTVAECNASGENARTRQCDSPAPAHGGLECANDGGLRGTEQEQTGSCIGYCAPVDGNWGEWSGYGECKESFGRGSTVRCNEAGKQIRSRSCDSPAPAHGGSRCQKTNGPLDITEEQISDCSGYCAPIDGGFTDWSSWGQCTEPCGQGDHSRTRTCTNPVPQHGGAACDGAKSDTGKCNEHACPIDGGFSDWSSWGECTKSCGGGEKSKTRTCSNPPPQFGGEACTGPKTDTETCNEQACPGISATCNDDNTISVKIDYDRAGSILSASYGTCDASKMAGADAANVKTWDVTLNPSRCGMETKLRTLNYTQTASFTVGRKHGDTQMKFATFEVDSYCSYTSEYTVSFSYGPVNADSFDFTESGGLLGLHFYIASYADASYEEKADPSSQAGKMIYLKLALDATKNADFDHATSMDASSGKVFVPTKCAVTDSHSNEYTLFDTSSSDKCANDNIDLKITYNKGDGQSWYIAHTLFLLNDMDTSTFTLSCNVLVCDAAQVTECKTAHNCLTGTTTTT